MISKKFYVKRIVLMAALFCAVCAAAPAQSQSLGKIAIPSFSGGSTQENNAIASLFLAVPEIAENFDVIPRTDIIKAAKTEKEQFQTSGITDEQYTEIGKEWGANFVMAGTITRLGKKKLLIVSIIKIPEIQEVAGNFLVYETEASLRDNERLSIMAKELIGLMKTNSAGRENLAIPLVQFEEGTNKQEGDALAQLLSIYLIRNGKYAVYPRTQTLAKVEEEYKVQASGVVAEEEQVSFNGGVNPEFALSVRSYTLDNENFFVASIIDLKKGTQKGKAFEEEYTDLFDGQYAIKFIADGLSGITVSAQERARRSKAIERQAAQDRKAAQQERAAAKQRERAYAFEQATDKYLRNTGMGFSGWVGFLPYDTGKTKIQKDKDTGEEKEVSETSSTISGGGEVEWRLMRYLGVQSGFWVVGYEGPLSQKELKTTVYQVPALVKLSTPLTTSLMMASIYGGLGYNVGTSFSANVKTDSLAPFAWILGGEAGVGAGWVRLLGGARYCMDFSESMVTIDAKEYTYRGSAWSIYVKLGLLIPWRSN